MESKRQRIIELEQVKKVFLFICSWRNHGEAGDNLDFLKM